MSHLLDFNKENIDVNAGINKSKLPNMQSIENSKYDS